MQHSSPPGSSAVQRAGGHSRGVRSSVIRSPAQLWITAPFLLRWISPADWKPESEVLSSEQFWARILSTLRLLRAWSAISIPQSSGIVKGPLAAGGQVSWGT